MRSSLAATTLLLIMGIFFFEVGCSSPHEQPVTKTLTNSIGVKLVMIPKGKFMMGSPKTEKDRREDEIQVEVKISENFYMGSTEVTQAQWVAVMGKNPSVFQGEHFPVENIRWAKAVDFCVRLSEMPEEENAGRKYRLPTDAEWEYACRAGTTTPFHFGSQLNGRQANCNGTASYGTDTKGPYLKETSAVGTYPANAWGLYDMHGNVWEWCSDWVREYPRREYAYPAESVTDPSGPAIGSHRVVRGGGLDSDAVSCRSAFRGRLGPLNQIGNLGFRVVMSSPGIPK